MWGWGGASGQISLTQLGTGDVQISVLSNDDDVKYDAMNLYIFI